MKKARFNELIIKDFRGLEDFTLKFNEGLTEIEGENGSGKTTLLDAIFWVFFGKDSNGNSKFDLLPLDEDKNIIPGKEPTVELKFSLDDQEVYLKKVQKKSTKYYIDEVDTKAKEYSAYISEIVNEKLFATLINPVYFGLNYGWKEQKAIILDSFEVEDTVIEKKKYTLIKVDVEKLGVDKSKSKYKTKVDDLKKDILKLQGTKEHLSKETKDKQLGDKEDIITRRDKTEETLKETEKQMDGVYPLKDELYKLNKKIDLEELKNQQSLKDAKTKVYNLDTKKANKMLEYKKCMSDLKNVKDTCSLCGSDLDEKGVQKQKDVLQEKIDSIIKEGKSFGDDIELAKLDVTTKEGLSVDQTLLDEKDALVEKIKSIEDTVDSDKIQLLRVEVRDLNTEISGYDAISKNIDSLKETKKKLTAKSDELDDAENMQALLKAYHKDYSQLVADKLNENFDKVKITTFIVQKNGEIKEDFSINMNGIPYKSLNSAGKIEAGMELIQMISKALGLQLPCVLDNKEGCTKNFKVDNQVLTLSVVKGAELRIV
jgi:DNA repair exonuclease SbcCD ATPase subunit